MVLRRLAQLNRQRWQAEQESQTEAASRQDAAVTPRPRRPRGRPQLNVIQGDIFDLAWLAAHAMCPNPCLAWPAIHLISIC